MSSFFLIITWLGSLYILLPLCLLICMVLIYQKKVEDALFLILCLIVTSGVTHLMKLVIARPRPSTSKNNLVSMPADFSFPSAHTSQITAFAGSMCLFARDVTSNLAIVVVWGVCMAVACLVGYSRVYLRVHYLTDVIAGAVVGVFVNLMVAYGFGVIVVR